MAIHILLAFPMILRGQTPAFKHYTTTNGLPSNSCYQLFQNARGYLWVGTNEGAARFDGLRFRNYTLAQGLKSNEIICISETADSALILGTYEDGISTIKNNKVSDTVFQYKPGTIHTFLESEHKIYVPAANEIILFDKKRQNGKANITARIPFIEFKHKSYSTQNAHYTIIQNKLFQVTDEGLKPYLLKEISGIELTSLTTTKLHLFLASRQHIYIYDHNTLINKIPIQLKPNEKITQLAADKKGNIIYVVNGEDIYLMNNRNTISLSKYLPIEHINVSDLIVDREDNLWISTYGSGLLYVFNYFITNINLPSTNATDIINDILIHNDKLGIATNNDLLFLEKNKFTKTNLNHYIYNIDNGKPWNISSSAKIKSENIQSIDCDFIKTIGQYQFIAWDNKILKKFKGQKDSIILPSSIHRVNDIHIQGDKIYIATKKGLYTYDKQLQTIDSLFNHTRIREEISKGILWTSSTAGLFSIAKNQIKNIRFIDHIELGPCYDILIIKNEKYVACKAGLISFYDEEHVTNRYNTSSGILGAHIYKLAYDSIYKELWLGTDNGLSLINLDLIPTKQITPTPRVEELITDQGTYVFPNQIKLAARNTQLKIIFSTPSFTETENIQYKYHLDSEEDAVLTDERTLTLSALDYGKHTLSLRARGPNYLWSNEANFEFYIAYPWYLSKIAKIIYILLSGLLLYLLYRYLTTRKKKQIAETEKQRLRANQWKQNALLIAIHHNLQEEAMENSASLMKQNSEHGHTYFTIFKNFNEEALQHSKDTYSTLEEELELVNYYIETEQARLNDSIAYSQQVDEDIIPQSIKLPTLTLIPFIQNAIWHLQFNKGQKGNIHLSIKKAGEMVEISITDDGVGIKTSAFFKQNEKIVENIKAATSRLSLLQEGKVTTTDLSDLQDQDRGTLTSILFRPLSHLD